MKQYTYLIDLIGLGRGTTFVTKPSCQPGTQNTCLKRDVDMTHCLPREKKINKVDHGILNQ